MKKIKLNKAKLNERKFNLVKEKIANLTFDESLRVIGGGTDAYISCAQPCNDTNVQGGGCISPTSALAGCVNSVYQPPYSC